MSQRYTGEDPAGDLVKSFVSRSSKSRWWTHALYLEVALANDWPGAPPDSRIIHHRAYFIGPAPTRMRAVLSGTEESDFPWGIANHERVVDFWTSIAATSTKPRDTNFIAIHLFRSDDDVAHSRTCISDPDLYDPTDEALLDNAAWLKTRLAELEPDFPPLP